MRFNIGNDKKDFKIRITHNCLFLTDLYGSHNRSRNRKRRVHAVPWLIALFLGRIEPLSTLLAQGPANLPGSRMEFQEMGDLLVTLLK